MNKILLALLGYLIVDITSILLWSLLSYIVREDIAFVSSLPFYDDLPANLIYTCLMIPLVEEVVFRGAPMLLFGTIGLVVGSFVWAISHIPSRMQTFANYPTAKKVAVASILMAIYTVMGVYYTWVWYMGLGLLAIFLHMLHNGVVTLADHFRTSHTQTDLFEEKKEPVKEPEPVLWEDANPTDLPPLEPVEPKYFRVIAGEDGVRVEPAEKLGNTKAKVNPKKVKSSRQVSPSPKPAPTVASIMEQRWRLKGIEEYIEEQFS